MTVKDLVELLQTFPQNSTVLYCLYSDYSVLEAEDITVQKSTEPLRYSHAVLHHNMPGEYRMYGGPWEHKGSPPPIPADVVIFPGN